MKSIRKQKNYLCQINAHFGPIAHSPKTKHHLLQKVQAVKGRTPLAPLAGPQFLPFPFITPSLFQVANQISKIFVSMLYILNSVIWYL